MPDSSGTPRDRAISAVALGIEEEISEFVHQRVDEQGGGFEADATDAARACVDTLLAHPDILRELAGGTPFPQSLWNLPSWWAFDGDHLDDRSAARVLYRCATDLVEELDALSAPSTGRRHRVLGRGDSGRSEWQVCTVDGCTTCTPAASTTPSGGAPVADLGDRFRSAADAVEALGWAGTAYQFRDIASQLEPSTDDDAPAMIGAIESALAARSATTPAEPEDDRVIAARRLRSMAPFHRDDFSAVLRGIADWMEYSQFVDDGEDPRAAGSARALLGGNTTESSDG